MSLQIPVEKCGGYVEKAMNGKLQLVIGAKDLVVPTAAGRGFVMITVYRPSTPNYLHNGTLRKTTL